MKTERVQSRTLGHGSHFDVAKTGRSEKAKKGGEQKGFVEVKIKTHSSPTYRFGAREISGRRKEEAGRGKKSGREGRIDWPRGDHTEKKTFGQKKRKMPSEKCDGCPLSIKEG